MNIKRVRQAPIQITIIVMKRHYREYIFKVICTRSITIGGMIMQKTFSADGEDAGELVSKLSEVMISQAIGEEC